RCLQKDGSRRLRDIGDARLEIEDALASSATGESDEAVGALPRWRWMMMWSGPVFLICAVIIALAVWVLRPTPLATPISRLAMTLPADAPLDLDHPSVAISPDGTHLVYTAVHGGRYALYLRTLDQMEARPIPGSEDGLFPFFS